MKAVYNTSPIIFLNKLNLLESAFSLFSENVIPSGVIEEVRQRSMAVEKSIDFFLERDETCINSVKKSRFYTKLREVLGKGETEAIILGLDLDADYIILDDKAARNKALSLGLKVKGTIGILRSFYQKGLLISDPEKIYQQLKNFNFRVNHKTYKSILREFYPE